MDLLKPKKSARISPDRPSVATVAIVLVCLVMVASMAFSFAALHDAGAWTFNRAWAYFLVPIFIDGAILAYTISFSIRRWRSEPKEARNALRWLRFFTGFSSVVNGMHAASGWQWDYSRYEMWGGIAIAALAPVAALVSAEQIIGLVFQKEHQDKAAQESSSPIREASEGQAHPGSLPMQEADTASENSDIAVDATEWEARDHGGVDSGEDQPESVSTSVPFTSRTTLSLVPAETAPVLISDDETSEGSPEVAAPQLTVDGDGLFKIPTAS